MKFDISPVINGVAKEISFHGQDDFSFYKDQSGENIMPVPAEVDVLVTDADECIFVKVKAAVDVHSYCARCSKPIVSTTTAEFDFPVLSDVRSSSDDREDDSGIVISGNEVDVTQAVLDALVLEMPMRYLCDENCKGFCPNCGADLNREECKCKNDNIDPRLAVLKKFIKD